MTKPKSNDKYYFDFGEMKDVDALDFSKRFGGSISLSYNPKYLEDVRLFVQYYYGQDYYNIHFENTLSELRIGLMADPFGIKYEKNNMPRSSQRSTKRKLGVTSYS